MNHGSLFSGIGGFDLAAQWMGWNNLFHCEKQERQRRVLNYYWPEAISYDNIKETNFTIWRGRIDVLTGGFPCQPYSLTGKREGKNDERHLWPEMLRAIREIKPAFIVGENVRGLISWNDGMVFEEVQANLEAEAYQVQPFLLPACGVQAPHERYRIWFVAYSNDHTQGQPISGQDHGRRASDNEPEVRGQRPSVFFDGLPEISRGYTQRYWEEFPTQSPLYPGNDGLSTELDGITLSQWKEFTNQSAGNAVVPQLVYPIFQAIEQYNNQYRRA